MSLSITDIRAELDLRVFGISWFLRNMPLILNSGKYKAGYSVKHIQYMNTHSR